jgi:putative flippase GtrA
VDVVSGAVPAEIGIVVPRRVRFRLGHPLVVQVVRYMIVGGAGTAANAAIFLLLRSWFEAVPANLVALVLSTAVSTELNRRFTFGGAVASRWRSTVQNGGTVLFYAFYSSAVLLLLGLLVDAPGPQLESLVVAAASTFGGTVRFLVLRQWVFRRDPGPVAGSGVDPQTSPREKSEISVGTAASNPATSSMPESAGSAMDTSVAVIPTTTSRARGLTRCR